MVKYLKKVGEAIITAIPYLGEAYGIYKDDKIFNTHHSLKQYVFLVGAGGSIRALFLGGTIVSLLNNNSNSAALYGGIYLFTTGGYEILTLARDPKNDVSNNEIIQNSLIKK